MIIPPVKLVDADRVNQALWDFFLANVRTPRERAGDLQAQLAANRIGEQRLGELASRYGVERVRGNMSDLLAYSEHLTRHGIRQLPNGT